MDPFRLQKIVIRHAVHQAGDLCTSEKHLIREILRRADEFRLEAFAVLLLADIPAVLTAQGNGLHAPAPLLVMPAIAPVGDEVALRPVFHRQLRTGAQVEGSHVHAAGQAAVGIHRGTDVIAHARVPVGDAMGSHPLGLDQLISPFQSNGVLGHHVVALRIVVDHVRPEHDLLPIGVADVAVQLVQPLHEQHVLALFTADFLCLAAVQVVGFVQADVDISGGKVGQQGLVQVADKFEALLQKGVQGGG